MKAERSRAEKALKESEKKLVFQAQLLESVGQPIFACDLDGKVTYWNRSAENVFGWTADDVVGHDLKQLATSDQARERIDAILAAMRQGESWSGEFETRDRHGRSLVISTVNTPLVDDDGTPVGFIGVSSDITEQRVSQVALRKSEERFNLAIEGARAGIWDWDLVHDQAYWSPRLYRQLGHKPGDLELNSEFFVTRHVHPDDAPLLRETVLKHQKTREPFELEFRCRLTSGEYRWFRASGQSTWDEAGTPARMVGILEDIHESRLFQEQLSETREELQAILDNSPQMYILVGSDREVIRVNRKGQEYTQKTSAEMIGLLAGEALNCLNAQEAVGGCGKGETCQTCFVKHTVQESISGRRNIENVEGVLLVNVDGKPSERHLNLSTTFLTIAGRERVLVSLEDITERKEAEKALRESEQNFRTIFEQAPLGIGVLDYESGAFLRVNEKFCEITGYSKSEMLGMVFQQIIHPDDIAANQAQMRSFEKADDLSPFSTENRYFRKDKASIWGQLTAVPMWAAGEKPRLLLTMVQDITAQKGARESLAESEKKLRDLLKDVRAGVVVHRADTSVEFCNQTALELMGLTEEQLLGEAPAFPSLKLLREDGSVMPLEEYPVSIAASSLKTISDYVVGLERPDRPHPTWILVAAHPVLGQDQRLEQVIVSFLDITESIRSREEKAALESQLRHLQKVEAIGTLAGGIAHDFNNILSAIIGFSQLNLDALDQDSKIYLNTSHVLEAGLRAKELVKQILTFSRQAEQELSPVMVQPIAKEALKLLRATLPSFINIREKMNCTSVIYGDPTQFHQVLMNLCTNAWQAMRNEGGEMEVELTEVSLDEKTAAALPGLKPGPHVRLKVADSGVGMDRVVMERIFDPYFTTKTKGEGTGLGLSVVQGLVKTMKGAISVESEPGRGSTFSVYWPVLDLTVKTDSAETDLSHLTGDERVMVVDDEPSVSRYIDDALSWQGYRIETFNNGIEALEAFRRDPRRWDLVITDMTMPGLTGDQLAQELMTLRPGLPVIITTGYSERIDEEGARRLGAKALLMKPLIMADLLRSVRRALDDSKPQA